MFFCFNTDWPWEEYPVSLLMASDLIYCSLAQLQVFYITSRYPLFTNITSPLYIFVFSDPDILHCMTSHVLLIYWNKYSIFFHRKLQQYLFFYDSLLTDLHISTVNSWSNKQLHNFYWILCSLWTNNIDNMQSSNYKNRLVNYILYYILYL